MWYKKITLFTYTLKHISYEFLQSIICLVLSILHLFINHLSVYHLSNYQLFTFYTYTRNPISFEHNLCITLMITQHLVAIVTINILCLENCQGFLLAKWHICDVILTLLGSYSHFIIVCTLKHHTEQNNFSKFPSNTCLIFRHFWLKLSLKFYTHWHF